MNLTNSLTFVLVLLSASLVHAQWPMSNDPAFDPAVAQPRYAASAGPRILLDNAHHNFHVHEGFMQPFIDLAEADGYQPVIDDETFSAEYLARYDTSESLLRSRPASIDFPPGAAVA